MLLASIYLASFLANLLVSFHLLPALPPSLLEKKHLPLHHRVVLQHAQRSGGTGPAECAVVTGHRHADEAHGDCAGFGWVVLVRIGREGGHGRDKPRFAI